LTVADCRFSNRKSKIENHQFKKPPLQAGGK